jgi:hypothetical protein
MAEHPLLLWPLLVQGSKSVFPEAEFSGYFEDEAFDHCDGSGDSFYGCGGYGSGNGWGDGDADGSGDGWGSGMGGSDGNG